MKRKAPFSAPSDQDEPQTWDNSEDTNQFLSFYKDLPKKTNDLIRFFDKKTFYAVYEDDADLIADEFYHSRTVIKKWELGAKSGSKTAKVEGPRYMTLPIGSMSETVMRSLIHERRCRIEIYRVDNHKWRLFKKGSPGNLQELEDILFSNADMEDSQVMVALKLSTEKGATVIGAAYCDVLLKKIGVSEFVDNDHMSNLETFLLQIGAKECYSLPLDEKDIASRRLFDVLDRCQVSVTSRKRADFDPKNIEQDLKRLLGSKYYNAIPTLDAKHAMGAASCLISGLDLLSEQYNEGLFQLVRYDLAQYMRLDAAAISALNLLPNHKDPNQSHNLYGLLNKCKTPMGSRKLMQWIKQPLMQLESIEERLNIVQALMEDFALCTELRSTHFRKIPDIERISKKIQSRRAGLQDCVLIYQFCARIPAIVESLRGFTGANFGDDLVKKFIVPLTEAKNNMKGFEELIEATIDVEAAKDGEYTVSPKFDPLLEEIHDQRVSVKKQLDKHESSVRSDLDNPGSFKREMDKQYGWIFKLGKKDEKLLQPAAMKKKYEVIGSIKSGVKFRDAKLRSLSDNYRELTERYDAASSEVVREIMNVAQTYMPVLESLHEMISELDCFASLSEVSHNAPYPYVRPQLSRMGEGSTILKRCRHPVLEVQPDMNFVPNDVALTRDASSFIIITGPNMGGKSTYIRQIGVSVLMAQIGCFIPCEEGSSVCIADAILSRVGAGDSQLRGVSTFMAEMLETATILKTASSNSLVIIDELGRGTSTYDGFGLAWAISEYICKKIGAFCLFATHFHELTQLGDEVPHVANKHVSALPDQDKGIVLQYTVADGPSDQSFGIHVAKIAKFPDQVIQMAEQKASELENFETSNAAFAGADQATQTEAEANIMSYLKEFSSWSLESMSPTQISSAIATLKTQMEQNSNPIVKNLIASVASK